MGMTVCSTVFSKLNTPSVVRFAFKNPFSGSKEALVC